MNFSIVVPSFNHAEFLGQCLDSLLEQSGSGVDTEIVVMDGGSRDGSYVLLEHYAPRLAYWVSTPDDGQSDALARGFARTTGNIMGYVNSDDWLLPGALSRVAESFRRHPDVDVIYGDALLVDRAGNTLRMKREIDFDLGILLWDYCYLPQTATFWRRRAWNRISGIDPQLQCAMDYDLWLKFAKAGALFRHVNTPLAAMRIYPGQKNQRLRVISDSEDRMLRSAFLGRPIPTWEAETRRIWHKSRRVIKKLLGRKYQFQ